MKRFVLLFITSLLIFTVSPGYARGGGGHGGGGHGGGGHGGGGHGWGGHGGGHGWGGHGWGGIYLGFGGYYPRPYYYYPPYYPARRVIRSAPATSTVYVERPKQVEPAYWYYCTEPRGYYPQVNSCSTDWLQVVPRKPGD